MTTFDFMVNRWLGVSGSGYCEEFMVFTASGLQLTMASASIRASLIAMLRRFSMIVSGVPTLCPYGLHVVPLV